MAAARAPPACSRYFVVDGVGNFRISAIDPALFMRLSDLLLIVADDDAGGGVPEAFVRLVDERLSRTLAQLHAGTGLLLPPPSRMYTGARSRMYTGARSRTCTPHRTAEKRIHGDVSPDNVVITHYGGCSLLHPSTEPSTRVTPYNVPVGDTLGPAHDTFALGCLLYAMVTRGAAPFVGDTLGELRVAMARGPPPLGRLASPDLADLIVRGACLHSHVRACARARASHTPWHTLRRRHAFGPATARWAACQRHLPRRARRHPPRVGPHQRRRRRCPWMR